VTEKEWRFIDDDVIVGFIDDIEMEYWGNGIMQ